MRRTKQKEKTQGVTAKDDIWLLFRGIKSLLRCDDAEVVQELARYIMSQHSSLQVSNAFIERKKGTIIPNFIAFLSGVTRFLEVHSGRRKDNIVWVARYDNERRAIEKLQPLIPELSWTELEFRRPPSISAIFALLRLIVPNWRRFFRLTRLLHQRHKFFKVFRVVELISYFIRYRDIFENSDFRLAVVSNHSNPHGIAFNLAARRCGIPVVLITHGMPVRPVAKLSFDLAVVHCQIAHRIYLEAGCKLGETIAHGRRQNYLAMPDSPLPKLLNIGIFLCKDVNEERLQALVNNLVVHPRVSNILIRPHPKNLWLGFDQWIQSLNSSCVQKSSHDMVSGDLEMLDMVFGGNSSVLVEAVTAGRPSVYISGLDCGSTDLHEFVAHGLVYQMNGEMNFDPDAILRFYLKPEWTNVLRLFSNIDEDEVSVNAQIEYAVRRITGLTNYSE